MSKQNKPRFIRRNGRVIPIGGGRNSRAASDILSRKNAGAIGTIAGTSAAYAGGLYASGRLHRHAKAVKSAKLNRVAKLGKFGAAFGAGIVGASALASIDKKSRDEGTIFNIGAQSKTALGHAATFAGAYGLYRVGKRFEYAGKLGKNLFKKKDLMSMRKLSAI